MEAGEAACAVSELLSPIPSSPEGTSRGRHGLPRIASSRHRGRGPVPFGAAHYHCDCLWFWLPGWGLERTLKALLVTAAGCLHELGLYVAMCVAEQRHHLRG